MPIREKFDAYIRCFHRELEVGVDRIFFEHEKPDIAAFVLYNQSMKSEVEKVSYLEFQSIQDEVF